MKRFIRYLYEYDQGQLMRNVGFVKVEQSDEWSGVHIHGKGLSLPEGEEIQIFLFFVENEGCVCIDQGKTRLQYPELNIQLCYTAADTGVPENYDKISGILLESSKGKVFAALWQEMPVNIERRSIWIGEQKMEESMEESAEEEEKESLPELEETPVVPQCYWRARKIQRTQLSELAHCEWRLANNKFLLHGYYNYHHLIFLENESCLLLGVPGIYHTKEAMLAADFGFPEFVSPDQFSMNTDTGKTAEERFGYWCRPVKKGPQWSENSRT